VVVEVASNDGLSACKHFVGDGHPARVVENHAKQPPRAAISRRGAPTEVSFSAEGHRNANLAGRARQKSGRT